MAGGSPAHAALAGSVIAALVPQLRDGPCRVYSSGLRVRVPATGIATYPDVSVVCGEIEHDLESPTTVVNPKVVCEVLSESTAAYDRGEKLEQYKCLDSLEAVLLFSQTSRRVEVHRRTPRGWSTEVAAGAQDVDLACLQAKLSLASVYADAGI